MTSDIIVDFLPRAGLVQEEEITDTVVYLLKIGLVFFVFTPASLIKKLHELQYLSLAAFIFTMVIGVVVIVETPLYMSEDDYDISKLKLFSWDPLVLFNAVAVSIFAYAFQWELPDIFREINKKTKANMDKISTLTLILGFSTYQMFGTLGALSTTDQTTELVMLRPPIGGAKIDYAMIIIQAFLVLLLIAAYALYHHIGRVGLLMEFRGSDEMTFAQNVSISYRMAVLVCAIALSFPTVLSILGVTGGILSGVILFTFPTYIHYMLEDVSTRRFCSKRNGFNNILGIFLTLFSLTSGIISFVDIF